MNSVPVVIADCANELAGLRGSDRVARQSALARQALATAALAIGARLGTLEKDALDAPLPSNGWHWSLSHGSRFVAATLSRSPIGVDVEEIRPRRTHVVPRVTSRDELELLGGFAWPAFVRVWTAKEAVLKRAGVGLAELSRCRLVAVPDDRTLVLRHRDRDHVVRQFLSDLHVVSVACGDALAVDLSWRPVPRGLEHAES